MAGDNGSIRLDLDNEPQPDILLMIEPERRRASRISEDDYVEEAPELVAEIAASSVSYDLGKKLHAYRRNGVREYIVWRVQDREIDWFVLRDGSYEPLAPDADGLLRSEVFPGLVARPRRALARRPGRGPGHGPAGPGLAGSCRLRRPPAAGLKRAPTPASCPSAANRPLEKQVVGRMLELARRHPDDPASFDAVAWVAILGDNTARSDIGSPTRVTGDPVGLAVGNRGEAFPVSGSGTTRVANRVDGHPEPRPLVLGGGRHAVRHDLHGSWTTVGWIAPLARPAAP